MVLGDSVLRDVASGLLGASRQRVSLLVFAAAPPLKRNIKLHVGILGHVRQDASYIS